MIEEYESKINELTGFINEIKSFFKPDSEQVSVLDFMSDFSTLGPNMSFDEAMIRFNWEAMGWLLNLMDYDKSLIKEYANETTFKTIIDNGFYSCLLDACNGIDQFLLYHLNAEEHYKTELFDLRNKNDLFRKSFLYDSNKEVYDRNISFTSMIKKLECFDHYNLFSDFKEVLLCLKPFILSGVKKIELKLDDFKDDFLRLFPEKNDDFELFINDLQSKCPSLIAEAKAFNDARKSFDEKYKNVRGKYFPQSNHDVI